MKVKFSVSTNSMSYEAEEVVEISDDGIKGLSKEEVINHINAIYNNWLFIELLFIKENIQTSWSILDNSM